MEKVVDKDWQKLKQSNIFWSIAALLALFTVAGALSLLFEDDLQRIAKAVVDHSGFAGLAFALFISDAITSPLPPDAVLFVLAKSHLAADWEYYVTILSLISVLAGNFGWLGGYLVSKSKIVPKFIVSFANRKQDLILKYGHWVVILGALTPLPFSVTCWGAGMVRLPWTTFFWACLFRIPRIFAVYILLHNSNFNGSFQWLRAVFGM